MLRIACVVLVLFAVRSAPVHAADIVLRLGSINTEGTAPYDQALVPFVAPSRRSPMAGSRSR